ncbi:MAG: hypothetical protein M1480_10650 [Bacteroidetes bacterium]|nr:hypothetical protein [Bacteroidota bacterium]
MRKKTLTIEDIEKKLKAMGGVEVPEKEFDTLEEYKSVSGYVKNTFRASKAQKKTKLLKTKIRT